MPLRAPAPSALTWRCSQCASRSFSSSTRQLAVGPEHPRYVEIPEPPQQTVPYKGPVKGVLPVPRDVFAGLDRTKSDDEFLAGVTKSPLKARNPTRGSRTEWKAKITEMRKQNLREGFKSLRARQQSVQQRMSDRSAARRAERERLLHLPEREDERLTAPSNNLEALLKKPVLDPTREQRLERKRMNLEQHNFSRRQERLDSLHTLYMNARDFIVTPQQLDKAVDDAFGTAEKPIVFGHNWGHGHTARMGKSVWAEGRPMRVQELLNAATGNIPRAAAEEMSRQSAEVNDERISRIAEALTGGKMDKEAR